ncbi:MAG: Spheroidene monooxygenase [Pseudomonadota bacterium]|jgi:spheroidene monooxygenase
MAVITEIPTVMDKLKSSGNALASVVVAVLVDFRKAHRSWGWMRLVAGPSAWRAVPGLLSAKVMGSGHNGGFTLRPSATHQGLLCRFEDTDSALDFLHSEQVRAYRERARECWAGVLAITSARGLWDQQPWGPSDAPSQQISQAWQQRLPPAPTHAPLAVITRASIHPAKAAAFWRYAPAAQASLDQAEGCQLAMGLGEAPLLRQCTFSLWQDEAAMHRYAREGAHQIASQAAWRHGFFSESLFVHLRVLRMAGQWRAQSFGNSLGWSELAHG